MHATITDSRDGAVLSVSGAQSAEYCLAGAIQGFGEPRIQFTDDHT